MIIIVILVKKWKLLMIRYDEFCGIGSNKNYFRMMGRMEESLAQLVEDITVNVGYPMYFESLDILLGHQFYFDIARLVFPQLNIKIIKIAEEQPLDSTAKIQMLLQLLTAHLQINLSAFSPHEILKGNYFHIHGVLKVLKEFSDYRPEQIQQQLSNTLRRVKTFPGFFQPHKNTIFPKTARELNRSRTEEESIDRPASAQKSIVSLEDHSLVLELPDADQKTKEEEEKKESPLQESKVNKEGKKRKITKHKNLKGCSLLQKNCLTFNKKYQAYLQKLMKPAKNKKIKEKSISRSKSVKPKGWIRDVEEIDNFFQSFSSKLDSQKQKYIKKMQEVIRAKEKQRMVEQHKLLKEKLRRTELNFEREISKLCHTHQAKKQMLKEVGAQNRQSLSLMRKQFQKNLRQQRKDLKEKKKQQLKQIKTLIEQRNERILMKFQQGGYYQKMVLDLYRKY